MTLIGLIDLYAAGKLRFSRRTLDNYRTTAAKLGHHLGRPAVIEDLNDRTMLAFLRWRLEERSEATARKDRQQLLAVWRWAYRKGHTEIEPRDIPDITVPQRQVRAWHPNELEAMLRAARKMRLHRDWGPPEWRALVLVAYDSGERIGALTLTPLSGYDRDNRVLTIPAFVRKYGQRDHLASLHATTCEAVDRMLSSRRAVSDRLFAWWGTYDSLRRHFLILLEAAGIDASTTKPFHGIRRASYTAVVASCGRDEARRHCGHGSDLSRSYLDERLLDQLRPEERTAERMLRPTG